MPTISNLQDLLVHQLRDLYSAERQLVSALPKMAKQCVSEELQQAMTTHLEQTQEQVSRLEEIFEQLGVSSRGPKCKAMEGLIEEGKEMMEEDIEESVLDAGIIASAQRVEHYEIAAYGTVVEFARALGHTDIMNLLQQTLDEEKETNEILTTLAEGGINALADGNGMASEEAGDGEDAESDDESEPEGQKERGATAGAKKAPTKKAATTRRAASRRS